MSAKILSPTEIPVEIYKYICERWAYHLKAIRQKFVEAGLAGKRLTEKAHDMPWKKVNSSCEPDGTWKFDWDSKEDTGDIVLSYASWKDGYRSVADKNYDYLKAFEEGLLSVEKNEEEAMKMVPLVQDMSDAFTKAVRDAEQKFKIKLPTYT